MNQEALEARISELEREVENQKFLFGQLQRSEEWHKDRLQQATEDMARALQRLKAKAPEGAELILLAALAGEDDD